MRVNLFDLLLIYETEVKKNVRNKKKILDFEKHKMEYLVDIKNMLENNLYNGGKYNIFLVFEPKVRVIMAQGIYDKIINHYVTRYILIGLFNIILVMKERYLVIKKLYKDYVILIKNKNNNYISFDEDEKIIHYFSIKDVNTIYLNNLEIEEKYEYENNKYNELYLKVKIIEMLEVLCKKELE